MNLSKIKKSNLKKIYGLFTLSDKILIISLLSLSFILFYFISKSHSKKVVAVYYQGKLIGKYSKDVIVKPDKGIEVEIKNGKARILHSTCKKQYCVKQGWSDSFPLVCVPNKLIVKFESRDKILITK